MNAIVIVFIPKGDGQAEGETMVTPIVNLAAEAIRAESQVQDETPRPFWTWFIENPRSRAA